MHVLILFTSGEIGGAERSLTRLAAQSDSRVRYSVATLGGKGAWSNWANEIGLRPTVLGRDERAGSRLQVFAILRLLSFVRRLRPDFVYVIGIRASLMVRVLRPVLRGAKVVHGLRANYPKGTRGSSLLVFAERFLGVLVDHYITNSKAAADLLTKKIGVPASKVSIIYNGIDPVQIEPRPLAEREDLIVTVANLSPRKNHLAYLSAIERIVHEYPSARFVFAGRDDMDGVIQLQVAHRGLAGCIEFVGYIEDTFRLLARAKMFVLPSIHEGMPTAILESMVVRTPVIAFNIDGIPELVTSGKTGVLIERNNFQALASAALELLKNPEKGEEYAASAYEFVRSKFVFSSMQRLHADVFSQLRRN